MKEDKLSTPLTRFTQLELDSNNCLNLLDTLAELNDMDKINYIKMIDETIDQLLNNKRTGDKPNPQLVITFEGIDATGKGTQSKLLDKLIREVDAHFKTLPTTSRRIQIPDYNTHYGKEIKRKLTQSNEDEILSSSREMGLDFALNRKEVQNRLSLNRTDITQGSSVLIFDRWTNSSVAFSLAKKCLRDKAELSQIISPNDDISNYLYNELIPLKYEIEYTEREILGLHKPDIEILLTADISLVKERIKNRRANEQGLDIHDTDAHEENTNLLLFTQAVYKNIYETNQNCIGRIIIENDPSLDDKYIHLDSRIIYLDKIVKQIVALAGYEFSEYKKMEADDDDWGYELD